jgi:hypothetical protein
MGRRRFQFRLYLLFATITVVAISLWAERRVAEWWTTVPLASVIQTFNAGLEGDSSQAHRPVISETEVLASVQSQLPVIGRHADVKAVCNQIVRTRRLPRGAIISLVKSQGQTPAGYESLRFVSLDVMTRDNRHCSIPIRQIDGR